MSKLPLLLALVVGVALWAAPSPTLAADGDQFAGATVSKGDWRIIAAITICDGKVELDTGCDQLDLQDTVGITDRLVFARRQETGCTLDPTLTVTTSDAAAATYTYNLGSAGADLTVNDATPRVTLMVDQGASPGRYLNFAITNDDDCTDLDFIMLFVSKAGAGE